VTLLPSRTSNENHKSTNMVVSLIMIYVRRTCINLNLDGEYVVSKSEKCENGLSGGVNID